ncbi:capsular polysaccharide transport system permease protein [Rhodovulum bhavnagarense]|uniref:Capsular polysaccharide transport system permease protein n=1 Tax=Rhodovulum bhavnagarense TaxID=992286 RepID=A0A4R2RB71_9RHOB|nr:ABC transporter permease [Rhodovulum bhavnagarense]TCP60572.1 capsular polysaccharide transport system permease protein [Rhodovulum bhavnagarense]
MTDSNPTNLPPLPRGPARTPRRTGTARVVAALVLREMSSTYGRSALGYVWAILEPVAGIFLLTFIFSLAFRSPGIGTSFPLFFASGILPFMLYMDISQKVSTSIRFSRQLLFYPGVTFLDAIIGRLILNTFTQTMVSVIVLAGIIMIYDLDVILEPVRIAVAFSMAIALGLGIGTLNCFLLSVFPVWERTWAILNRPLFIVSCIIFLYDSVPMPYREWIWWNPLVQVVGTSRDGIYATYDASYVSELYVFGVSAICFALGMLLLYRYNRDILND